MAKITQNTKSLIAKCPSSQASTGVSPSSTRFASRGVSEKKRLSSAFPSCLSRLRHRNELTVRPVGESSTATWQGTCTYHSESEVIEEVIRTLGLCKLVRRRGVDPHLNIA